MSSFTKHPLAPLAGHGLVLLVFIGINVLFFSARWERLYRQGGDTVQFQASAKESANFRLKTKEDQLWTDAILGGMPTYQLTYQPKGYYLNDFIGLFTLTQGRQVVNFFGFMLAFYIFMLALHVPWHLSAIGAIAFGFSTGNFILYYVGHNNKLATLLLIPLIVAGLFLMYYRRKYLLGGALFGISLGAHLGANHIQMTYYFALTLVILGIIWAVESIQKKELSAFLKTAAIAMAFALPAAGSTLSMLWPTYEYAQSSVRGDKILAQKTSMPRGTETPSSPTPAKKAKKASKKKKVESGLEYDYAVQRWSNTFLDVAACYIPRAAGGGSEEPVAIKHIQNYGNKEQQRATPNAIMVVPTYWGSLASTVGPYYFGAVVCFLFLFGIILLKGSIKWWSIGALFLTLLLSMGDNISFLQKFFFNYMPLYNKFRAPNSILSVAGFFLPLPGIYALSEWYKGHYHSAQIRRALLLSGGIAGGIALFFAAIVPSLASFTGPTDQGSPANVVNNLILVRKAILRADAMRTFFFVAAAFAVLYAWHAQKLKAHFAFLALGILILTDLWGVGTRYVNHDSFGAAQQLVLEKKKQGKIENPNIVDPKLLARNGRRGYSRVLDLRDGPTSSNAIAEYYNAVNGYHAAKLRRYEDLMNIHIANGTPSVLNMLNTQVVITPDSQVVKNPNALGPVWFVDTIRIVDTPDEEIDVLGNLNTGTTAAVLDAEFDGYTRGLNLKPSKGRISLIEYNPQHLVYVSKTPAEQFAVFSEIWYGPHKGWKAYIDGKEVPHIRANYVLRAMRIPPGDHRIEFIFKPPSVFLSARISGISSISLWVAFLLAIFIALWTQWRNRSVHTSQAVETATTASKADSNDKKYRKKK